MDIDEEFEPAATVEEQPIVEEIAADEGVEEPAVEVIEMPVAEVAPVEPSRRASGCRSGSGS